MAKYETTAQIINAVASEVLSLPADIDDPYTSVDPAIVQLRNLLTACGRELVSVHEWQSLLRTHSFVTTTEDEYDMPSDYDRFVNQTGWDRTNQLPLGGPLNAQEYAFLVNTGLAPSTIYVCFRVAKNKIQVLPDPPPVGLTIKFDYISRYWVGDGSTFTKDKPTAKTDYVYFDSIFMQKFLKLRFLEAKGFDTTAAVGQFTVQWNAQTGNDRPAPVLTLARGRTFPYLGYRNIPETGYGS